MSSPVVSASRIREKVRRLKLPRTLSVRTALVYDGDLAPEVEENGYFDALHPLRIFRRKTG